MDGLIRLVIKGIIEGLQRLFLPAPLLSYHKEGSNFFAARPVYPIGQTAREENHGLTVPARGWNLHITPNTYYGIL
jgi:hypothetical protein